MRALHSLLLVPLLAACSSQDIILPMNRVPVGHDGIERVDDTPRCEAPEAWASRMSESADLRGLDLSLAPTPEDRWTHGFQTGVIAEDIDQDGDVDLLFWDGTERLHLYTNDGAGDFSAAALPTAPDRTGGQYLRAAAAGDVDGDSLPDLVWVGDGIALWARNAGGASFGAWQVLINEPGPTLSGYAGAAFGDIEGDGDVDVVLAGLDQRTAGERLPIQTDGDGAQSWAATADRILLNVGGTLVAGPELVQPEGPTLSLVQTFSDRDLDGDTDLLSWSDRADAMQSSLGAAFWRNDRVELVNDAHDLSADTQASAMGAASADLNGDGLPDYCVTDIADRLTCLLSDGNGAYYEAAAALGLTIDRRAHPAWPGEAGGRDVYTGWGLELVDLDNDGRLDAASTGSVVSLEQRFDRPLVSAFQPHWLWRGHTDGRFQTDAGTDFGQGTTWAWGMASADLDGDGARELIAATWSGRPEVWDNPCTAGAALELSLRDVGANVHALGATVTVRDGDRTWQRTVGSMDGAGQSPATLHFGLGDRDRVDEIEVVWPGGHRTVHTDVATRGHIRIHHR